MKSPTKQKQIGRIFSEDAESSPSASTTGPTKQPYDPKELLAAIIESSSDAIISKTMDGVITSWNRGAEELFGYHSSEALGNHITMLIPHDRLEEEPAIVAQLRAGQKVDHFETVRRRKDGSLIDISLTISPIRDRTGAIIGASKVARDISASKKLEERQLLMLREMHHRVKNLFSLTSGLISMASKSASSPAELAASMRQRLAALAAAHELTLPSLDHHELDDHSQTTLFQLVEKVVAPYQSANGDRICFAGPDIAVAQRQATNLALLFHELATNSAKYGSLSVVEGRVSIVANAVDERARIVWQELGGPLVQPPSGSGGFGTSLMETIARGFPCVVEKNWKPEGLITVIEGPLDAFYR